MQGNHSGYEGVIHSKPRQSGMWGVIPPPTLCQTIDQFETGIHKINITKVVLMTNEGMGGG